MTYRTLGINPGHNGSVALIVDGKIELYIEEERLSRLKYDGNPFRGILEAISRGPIDEIVLGGTTPNFEKLPWNGEDAYSALVRKHYPKVKVTNMGNEHHLGHAAGAYYNSGFDTAVAVVVDGAGSYHIIRTEEGQSQEQAPQGFETESIFHCKDVNTITAIYKSYGNNKTPVVRGRNETTEFLFDDATTITKVYEAISHYLGFGFIEAGKTMGLAPYGRFDERMDQLFINGRANKNMIIPSYPAGAFIDINRYDFFRYPESSKDWTKDASLVQDQFKNIAWTVQDKTQKLVGDLVEKAIDMTGEKNVVISGGYALNCVANYYLRKRFPDINFFVDPAAHDGGTSIGLAKLAYFVNCKQKEVEPIRESLTTLYLGPNRIDEIKYFGDNFIGGQGNSEYENKAITPEEVAKLISDGNIVSIFQSRSEGGPRALGNRSIVYDPRVKDGKDIVNKVKGREWFRPFAGSVLKEDAKEWFDLAGMEESPFMMYAVDIETAHIGELPAITHVDNTCRVQTVSEDQNKHYYNLIKAFKDITGVPVLFNTSFNLAGDPLVETMDDAIQTLEKSDLKYLYLPEVGKLLTKGSKPE